MSSINLYKVRNIDIAANTASYELTPANLGFNPSAEYDNVQLAVSLGTAGSKFQVELKLVGCDFYIKPDLGGWTEGLDGEAIKLNCGADVFLAGPNLGANGVVFESIKVTFSGNTTACKLYAAFIKNNPEA